MRKLTTKQLERLRGIALAILESSPNTRADLGIAPEDLVIACDRALGWDDMPEEDVEEKHALIDTSHESCALAWRRRRG